MISRIYLYVSKKEFLKQKFRVISFLVNRTVQISFTKYFRFFTEIKEGLQKIDAIEISENCWTVLDSDMRMRVVSMICNVVSENSWSWDKVPKNEAVETLKELESEVIINQVFDQYILDDGKFLRDKLCRFYGDYLLQSSTAFNLHEFLTIWQDSLPKVDNEGEEPFTANLNQLEGLSLGKHSVEILAFFYHSDFT